MARFLLAQTAAKRLGVDVFREMLLIVRVDVCRAVFPPQELEAVLFFQDAVEHDVVREQRPDGVAAQVEDMHGVEHLIDMPQRLIKLHALLRRAILRQIQRGDAERRMRAELRNELDGRAQIILVARVEKDFFLPGTARRVNERTELVIARRAALVDGGHGFFKRRIAERLNLLEIRCIRVKAEERFPVKAEERHRVGRLADAGADALIVMARLRLFRRQAAPHDVRFELLNGHRAAVVISLHHLAADLMQEQHMLRALRAFGERAHAKRLRHVDDSRDDPLCLFRERREEAHVELDDVDVEILQRMERRIFAAEIVEPDLVALRAEVFDGHFELVRVLDERALAELDADELARDVIFGERLLKKAERVATREIAPRQIDGHGHDRPARFDALVEHAADLVEHGTVEFVDLARLLERGQEAPRRNHRAVGIHPADERLDAGNLFRQRADDGLVIHLDIPVQDGFVQRCREIDFFHIFVDHKAIPRS